MTGTWDTKTWSRQSFAILRATNEWRIGANPVLALQRWRSSLIRNSTNMKMMRKLITISGILQIEQQWQSLQPLTKNTKRIWFNKTFLIAKLKIISFWYREKSKTTTGIKNTASWIPWLYTIWDKMIASNMIHCFISDDNNWHTNVLHHVQTMLLDYIKANRPYIKKTNLLFWLFWRTVQKLPELYKLCSHKHGFCIVLNWRFFQICLW